MHCFHADGNGFSVREDMVVQRERALLIKMPQHVFFGKSLDELRHIGGIEDLERKWSELKKEFGE